MAHLVSLVVHELQGMLSVAPEDVRESLVPVITYLRYFEYLRRNERTREAVFLMHAYLDSEIFNCVENLKFVMYADLTECCMQIKEYRKAINYAKKGVALPLMGDEVNTESKRLKSKLFVFLAEAHICLAEYSKTVEYSEKILEIAKEIGNKEQEGDGYFYLGAAYDVLGSCEKAIQCHTKALLIYQEQGNKYMEKQTQLSLSSLLARSGNRVNEAAKCLEEGLNINQMPTDKQQVCVVSLELAEKLFSNCDFPTAIKYAEKSLEIARDLGNRPYEAKAQKLLGTCFARMGKLKSSVAHLEQGMHIYREIGDRKDLIQVNILLGDSYFYGKSLMQARESFMKVIDSASEIQYTWSECHAHGKLGQILNLLGETEEGLKHYEKQLLLAIKYKLKDQECEAYKNFSSFYLSRNINFDKCAVYEKKLLDIARESDDKELLIDAHCLQGRLQSQLGDRRGTEESINMALKLCRESGNKAREASICHHIGNAYLILKDHQRALHYFQQPALIDSSNKALYSSYDFYIGYCFFALDKLDEAAFHLQTFISQVTERSFQQADCQDTSRISLGNAQIIPYHLLAATLVRQEKNKEAILVEEKARARVLTDVLRNKCNLQESNTGLPEVLLSSRRSQSTVLYYSSLISNLEDSQRFPLVWVLRPGDEITLIQKGHLVDPNYVEDRPFKSHLAKLRSDLNLGRIVDCEDRSLSAIYSTETSNEGETDNSTCSTDALDIQRVRQTSNGAPLQNQQKTANRKYVEAHLEHRATLVDEKSRIAKRRKILEEQYNQFISPVIHLLTTEEIVIVPDRDIGLVPFSALKDPNGRYLSESFRIRLMPSLATETLISKHAAMTTNDVTKKPLIIGDPHVPAVIVKGKQQNVNGLPHARREAKEIGRLLGVTPLMGSQASKQKVVERLQTANIIHIAAHGDIEKGEILLAPDPCSSPRIPRIEECLLTLHDVSKVRIQANLVVLSCCHSGRGEVKAEGIVGIARAFIAAGACAVLVTLWAISDDATFYFMCSFYKYLTNRKTASEALHQTLAEMRQSRDFSDVRYWGPFVLVGEDVQLSNKQTL